VAALAMPRSSSDDTCVVAAVVVALPAAAAICRDTSTLSGGGCGVSKGVGTPELIVAGEDAREPSVLLV
jgi:hypothetical protein